MKCPQFELDAQRAGMCGQWFNKEDFLALLARLAR